MKIETGDFSPADVLTYTLLIALISRLLADGALKKEPFSGMLIELCADPKTSDSVRKTLFNIAKTLPDATPQPEQVS